MEEDFRLISKLGFNFVRQNLYDRDYSTFIPAGTQQVSIRVAAGDWLEVGEIGRKPAGAAKEDVIKFTQNFGHKLELIRYASGTPEIQAHPPMHDKSWLWKHNIEAWKEVQASGTGVMVGEWGCFNKTPHDAALRWAEGIPYGEVPGNYEHRGGVKEYNQCEDALWPSSCARLLQYDFSCPVIFYAAKCQSVLLACDRT